MLTLGIDIGTSGVRTAVLTADGTPISMAKMPHKPQDPERIDAELWWHAVQSCLRAQDSELRGTDRSLVQVSRIAIDGTSGSMVLTDQNVTPVSPALMYNSKGFLAEAERIAAVAPDPHIARGQNSALARAMRLVSLAEAKPAHLLHQADFIAAKLMARGGLSDPNNSLKTGFDPEQNVWPDWIANVFDKDLLPAVHPVGDGLGTVDAAVAADLGLSPDAVVCAGTTDSIAAFLAGADLDAGVAVTSLGSTLAIKMLTPTRIDDPSIGLYSHKVRDHWLVGGASNSGGAVLLNYFSPQEMTELSAQMQAETPTGLDYYPLLTPGERFPINDPTLVPRLTPRPAEDHIFLQAMFEGIARIEQQCFAEIQTRGGGLPTYVLSAGGGASNPVWSAIRASTLGLELREMTHSEAAIGAARVAQFLQ